MEDSSASVVLIQLVIAFAIQALMFWKVFEKAGYEGWKSLVPVYNTYILSKIGNQPIWVFIMLFIPLLNIIGLLLLSFGVAQAFGKSGVFGFFGLFFFSLIGYMILGFGDAQYQSSSAPAVAQ